MSAFHSGNGRALFTVMGFRRLILGFSRQDTGEAVSVSQLRNTSRVQGNQGTVLGNIPSLQAYPPQSIGIANPRSGQHHFGTQRGCGSHNFRTRLSSLQCIQGAVPEGDEHQHDRRHLTRCSTTGKWIHRAVITPRNGIVGNTRSGLQLRRIPSHAKPVAEHSACINPSQLPSFKHERASGLYRQQQDHLGRVAIRR